jgi:hypothetical protein
MKSSAEIGTVVGPNAYEEYLAARECEHNEPGKRDFWTVSSAEMVAVFTVDEPRSTTEIRLRRAIKR